MVIKVRYLFTKPEARTTNIFTTYGTCQISMNTSSKTMMYVMKSQIDHKYATQGKISVYCNNYTLGLLPTIVSVVQGDSGYEQGTEI